MKMDISISNMQGVPRYFNLDVPDVRYVRVCCSYDEHGEPVDVRIDGFSLRMLFPCRGVWGTT